MKQGDRDDGRRIIRRPSKKQMFRSVSKRVLTVAMILLAVVPHIFILWDCKKMLLTVSENSLYYVASTSASVVAGLYGITLTGYIFFLNQFQRNGEEDETLDDPIHLLKRNYNRGCNPSLPADHRQPAGQLVHPAVRRGQYPSAGHGVSLPVG
ncbi:MAG: hypothetical protein LUD82_04550 [Clostridiales bacterium]|nr:hypothetical protein [Clostridiales bacterium]